MAYPTEVDAVAAAPAGGTTLGGGTPTHTASHDQYRSALLSIKAKINSSLAFYSVNGLATGSGAAGANTTLIQASLDAAEAGGGGTVFIPAGTWQINNTLNLGTRVVLLGAGWASILFLANGSSTNAAPKSMVKAKANTNYVGVADIMLIGNSANQTDGTNKASHGVDFSRSGTEGAGAPVYDGGLWCRNVQVWDCQGTGFRVDGGATTMRLLHCYAYHNVTRGFLLKTDFIISDCVAANNGETGYWIENGTSGLCTNLKSFGASTGYKVGYSKSIQISNCQAEDTSMTGFTVTSSNHVLLDGCAVYRCANGTDNERSAYWIEDDGAGNLCNHVQLKGCTHLSADFGVNFRYGLWTRNLGTGIDIDLHTEGHIVAPRRFSTGSQAGKILFNGETPETIMLALGDETTAITTGTAKITYRMPFPFIVDEVRANVNTVSSSGVVTVDINEGGTSIISTKLTIDASEKTSVTAATPPVISDSVLADDAEITVDVDTAGTGAKGLKVTLIGRRTYP
jgi:hypothetical protein